MRSGGCQESPDVFQVLMLQLASRKLTFSEWGLWERRLWLGLDLGQLSNCPMLGVSSQLRLYVLFGIQAYWCQILILPKKVLKEVQKCQGHAFSRKSSVAWYQLHKPLVAGGWNLLDLCVWNKVAVTKNFWALSDIKKTNYGSNGFMCIMLKERIFRL